jgi:membrane dipeptidase
MPTLDEARRFQAEGVVADLHAHPALKTEIVRCKFWKRPAANKGFAPTKLRTNLPSLDRGGVNLLFSAIHVPEEKLRDDCWVIRPASWFTPRLAKALKGAPFEVTCDMMAGFEKAVEEANQRTDGRKAIVVRSRAELEPALVDPARPVIVLHTIEGAHSLGGILSNLRTQFEQGVCLLTLAHFYPNGVSPPVAGVPREHFIRKLGCFRWKPDLEATLPTLGESVVRAMLDWGILIDLTHTTPPARRRVYEINQGRRPLVLSHVGSTRLFDDPMNASPADVEAIVQCQGLIGVIFMTDWLIGPHPAKADTLSQVVATIRAFVDQGAEDCIALGSDFDGMTDPPDDLREPADFPRLTQALLEAFTPEQVRKFIGANALRALRAGWGR